MTVPPVDLTAPSWPAPLPGRPAAGPPTRPTPPLSAPDPGAGGRWRRDLGAGLALLAAAIVGAGAALTVFAAAAVVRSAELGAQDLAASADAGGAAWAAVLSSSARTSVAGPVVLSALALVVAALTAAGGCAAAAGRSRIPALVGLGITTLGLVALAVQAKVWLVLPVVPVPLVGLAVLGYDEAAAAAAISGRRSPGSRPPWPPSSSDRAGDGRSPRSGGPPARPGTS